MSAMIGKDVSEYRENRILLTEDIESWYYICEITTPVSFGERARSRSLGSGSCIFWGWA